jgi:hypothetical protein
MGIGGNCYRLELPSGIYNVFEARYTFLLTETITSNTPVIIHAYTVKPSHNGLCIK